MRWLVLSGSLLLLSTATARAGEGTAALAPALTPSADALRPAAFAAYSTVAGGASALGPAGFLSASAEVGTVLFAVRVAGTGELNILGPTPSESVSDYGVLVGSVVRRRYFSFSAAAGLGAFQSVTRGGLLSDGGDCMVCSPQYQAIRKDGIGVPFDVTLAFHGRYAGGGLSLFGNLNSGFSYVGLGLSFSAGKLL